MSGSSRSSRNRGNMQTGNEYWTYLPNNNLPDFLPARTSPNYPRERARDSWRLFEERVIGGGGPSYDALMASFPHAHGIPLRRASIPLHLLLMEDYGGAYPPPHSTTTPPPYNYQQPRYNYNNIEEEPRLSQEDQKQALNKLSKQLYSPHLNRIIKRLGGTGPTTSNNGSDDDDGKRCAVCLEDFDTKQYVTSTPCNHMFHEECIVPWVKSHGKCPVCRFLIIEKDRTTAY
ncbi:hypothetical protein ABFX02_08G200200 [Erythranthe guttata]